MSVSEDVRGIAARLGDYFPADVIKSKPQTSRDDKALPVFFIDARIVMNRLDEVVGPENWQDEYTVLPNGQVKCRLSLFLGGRWIAKEDVGGQSAQPDAGDREKSAFSDAFKRAAVKWNIGRYLYFVKAGWVDFDPQKKRFKGDVKIPRQWWPQDTKSQGNQKQRNASPAPPPPAEEKKPETLYQWVLRMGQAAVTKGLLREGELMAACVRDFRRHLGDDMEKWPEDEAGSVKQYVADFMARVKECGGDPLRKAAADQQQALISEAMQVGMNWPALVAECKWPAGHRIADLTVAQLAEAQKAIAGRAGAKKSA